MTLREAAQQAILTEADVAEIADALESTGRHNRLAYSLKARLVRKYISPVRTVADLANNLLLMDQALPIYGAQYIDHPTRGRCAIAVPPTVSRERVQDSRWIGQGNELNAAVVWTKAAQQVEIPQWQPIETAPKDSKRPLLIARFNDEGALLDLDHNAIWRSGCESFEMPEVYWYWASENDSLDDPTHWMYQPDWYTSLTPEGKK